MIPKLAHAFNAFLADYKQTQHPICEGFRAVLGFMALAMFERLSFRFLGFLGF